MILTALVTLLGSNTVSIANVATNPSPPPQTPVPNLDPSLQQLNLTPEQVQKIQNIEQKWQSAIKQKSDEYLQLELEYRQLMPSDAPSDQMRTLNSRQLALRQEMFTLDGERQIAIRDVLTVAQWRQRAEMRRQMRHGTAGTTAEQLTTRLSQNLNLNSEQTQKIQQIKEKYQSQLLALSPSIQQTAQNLVSLIDSDATTDQIRQKYHEMLQIMKQVQKQMLERNLAIRDVLNEQQRSQWKWQGF